MQYTYKLTHTSNSNKNDLEYTIFVADTYSEKINLSTYKRTEILDMIAPLYHTTMDTISKLLTDYPKYETHIIFLYCPQKTKQNDVTCTKPRI